ncbi:Uncharacterised protein [uncultured archaeon]|nr:Uncharacterised protein [uncultured archaeon]
MEWNEFFRMVASCNDCSEKLGFCGHHQEQYDKKKTAEEWGRSRFPEGAEV